jgi:hypothetical protein
MKDVTDRCGSLDFGFSKKLLFAKYLCFRPPEDRPTILLVKARYRGLRLGRWRVRAVTVPRVFDLLLKPGYTACRVWLPRDPFRSVVSA